ncbi:MULTISPECIES: hypothetical protein [unclassified Bradyrhizobium]|uniref:hypothetical protein n=1 Tax=unclassified Bradyrhizobium TaxID=2631580 RepID=UPI0024E0ED9A|nr:MULTISPECIES: hypothetical protein [unclassified Bradyrhizobium]
MDFEFSASFRGTSASSRRPTVVLDCEFSECNLKAFGVRRRCDLFAVTLNWREPAIASQRRLFNAPAAA